MLTLGQAQAQARVIMDALALAEHQPTPRNLAKLHIALAAARTAVAAHFGVDSATIVPDSGVKPPPN